MRKAKELSGKVIDRKKRKKKNKQKQIKKVNTNIKEIYIYI